MTIKIGQSTEANSTPTMIAKGSKFHKKWKKENKNKNKKKNSNQPAKKKLSRRVELPCPIEKKKTECNSVHTRTFEAIAPHAARKRSHFVKMSPSNKHVQEIMPDDSDPPVLEDEQIYEGCITVQTQSQTYKRKTWGKLNDWLITFVVNGSRTSFKIDLGSRVNINPKKDYHLVKNKPGLKPTRTRLTGYNGTSISGLGKYVVQIPHKNNIYDF